jgi:hypothetical protein
VIASRPRLSFCLAPAIALALSAAGCGGVTETPGPDASSGQPAASLAGTWEVVAAGGLFAPRSGVDAIEFVELIPSSDSATSGGGTAFGSAESGLTGCAQLTYAELSSGSVSLEVPALNVRDVGLVEYVDADNVRITDGLSLVTELRRAAAIPDELSCNDTVVLAELPLPFAPEGFSGLVNDGTRLWYEAADETWIPLDPTDDTFGTPQPIPAGAGQFSHIHAHQEGDFWTHCGCGGSEDARRVSPADGSTIDNVDTTALPTTIGIRGIAVAGPDLILAGFDFSDRLDKLLVVETAPGVEPTLKDEVVPAFNIGPLTTRDTQVWMLSAVLGPSLVRFDPTTGAVRESVKLPPDLFVIAFAWVDDIAYVLGSRADDPVSRLFKLGPAPAP